MRENGLTGGGRPTTTSGYNSAPESGEIAEAEQPAEEVATATAPSATGLSGDPVNGDERAVSASEPRCAHLCCVAGAIQKCKPLGDQVHVLNVMLCPVRQACA